MNENVINNAEAILARLTRFEQGCLECCVLAQIDEDGFPTAATISPSKIDGIRHVYFCSGLGSNWVKRAKQDKRASVCFNSEEEQYNISLVGDIEVVTEPDVKTEMWYSGMGGYFTGPGDPNFCVLKFTTKRYSLMLSEFDVNGQARGEL